MLKRLQELPEDLSAMINDIIQNKKLDLDSRRKLFAMLVENKSEEEIRAFLNL
jgi:anthranilate phosphoribosyltransferase